MTTDNPTKIIRLNAVQERTGIKRTHIYQLMKRGDFPQSIQLGIRAIGWNAHEVEEWIANRIAQRDQSLAEQQSLKSKKKNRRS